jgi:hypothetical protein
MIEHPLHERQAEGLGLFVVVEDLLVDSSRLGVLGGVLVLDGANLQEGVGRSVHGADHRTATPLCPTASNSRSS